MGYKCVYMLSEIKEYLKNTVLFAFDFETSPRDKWRNDNSAALDAHKADITGISFSVSEGTAIYVPLKHRSGRNAENQAAIWDYLNVAGEESPDEAAIRETAGSNWIGNPFLDKFIPNIKLHS